MNCSICLEDIGQTNCVLTECSHSFHSNCLMKNIAFNGFGCPYCRKEMATLPEETDEDEPDEPDEQDEPDEDYVFRGLRLFTNRTNDEIQEREDVINELYESGESLDGKPTIPYITEKLAEQGVTMEDFVKAMLTDINEYEEEEEEFLRVDEDLFSKMRRIIINYQLSF